LVAVGAATVYFLIQLGRNSLPALNQGSWSGFWLAADALIAVSVSWVPLAADYSRHSRSPRSAFAGSFIGYTVTQIAYYTLGLLAFTTLTISDTADHAPVFHALIAVPLGWLPFAVLVLRELDESFTNVYSTAVSVQNLRPLADRRILAVVIGSLATIGALALNIGDFVNFLYLLGSVFVPMFAVFAVDYFLLGGRARWNTDETAPTRWLMLVPWTLGFIAYQLVNPGGMSWWRNGWAHVQLWVHFTPQTWMSASIVSFVVAALVTFAVAPLQRRPRS
jgi:NCS1 family nucleobase:cation symporter-1